MRGWVAFPFLLAMGAGAQTASGQAFRTGTELVQVSVVAQNQDGKAIPDLRQEDFQIFDNGAPRKIALFLAEKPAPAREAAAVPAGVFTNQLATDAGTGYSVLLFDNLNTGFEHTARARIRGLEALQAIPAGDKIAMYALWCQFQVIREFTSDRDVLLRQLRAFYPAAGAVCAGSVPEEDSLPGNSRPSMADLINPGAAITRQRSAEEAARIAALQAGTITDQEMITIADHLAGIPGRKNLIWIAQKFPLSPTALKRLMNAGVVIYPVDAIGSTIGLASEKEAHAAPIRALAAMTGGKAYVDRDDLGFAIDEALNDGHVSYTLGFYRPEGDRAAAVHRIDAAVHRIEVRSRAGVVLRYRTSYSIEPPWPKDPDPVEKLVEAMNRPVEATAIGMTVAATRREKKLDLDLRVDAPGLDLHEKNGFWDGQAELVVRFMRNDGKIAGKIIALTMKFHLRPATYAEAQRDWLPFRREIEIPEKAVDINLVVGNLESGKIGTLRIPLSEVGGVAGAGKK
jgi:VWFA-related protein